MSVSGGAKVQGTKMQGDRPPLATAAKPPATKVSSPGSNDIDPKVRAIVGPRGYTVECKLGAGAYGVVYKAIQAKTSQVCAIKVIDLTKLSERTRTKCLPREVDTLLASKHENLVQVYDILRTEKALYIFMQFAANGDIRRYAKKNNGIKEGLACKWFLQATAGLAFLHGNLFTTHREIQMDNMLLDEEWRTMLTDFGFAKRISNQGPPGKAKVELSRTFCGTRPYECPQILEHRPYNGFKADIWSMGVTLWHMLYDRYPFDHKDTRKHLKQANNYPKYLKRELKREKSPHEVIKLFECMLNPNEKERASVLDIAKNHWLRSKASK